MPKPSKTPDAGTVLVELSLVRTEKESKNYQIFALPGKLPDGKKCPIMVNNNGSTYVANEICDKSHKKLKITVTVEE